MLFADPLRLARGERTFKRSRILKKKGYQVMRFPVCRPGAYFLILGSICDCQFSCMAERYSLLFQVCRQLKVVGSFRAI